MSKADDVFERVVDVHCMKIPKPALEEMFKRCGRVINMFHWRGGLQDKPHMLIEYASLDAAKSARALSNDKSGLQVIRAYNNDGLIRKFKELSSSHFRSLPSRPYPIPRGPRYRSRSPVGSCYLRIRPRETNDSWRPFSPSSKRGSPWKTDRYTPELRHSESSPVKPSSVIPSPATSQSCSDNKDRSHSKNLGPPVVQGNGCLKSNRGCPKQIDIPNPAAVLRIPYAGEVIQMNLSNQLEENPIGIITILTAAEAAQQLWMVVAAHYNSKNNHTSARKVLEAGIDLSNRLGRTDTRPFWYLLDQINSAKNSKGSSNAHPQLPEIAPSKREPGNKLIDRNTIRKPESKDSADSPAAFPSSVRHPPGGSENLTPVSSADNKIPPEIQQLIRKLENENKALRIQHGNLIDDLSEARRGKRRADDEIKEERTIRRKLERDLKQAELDLKRSKRMEQTALDQFKMEVESRRKTEILLANHTKAQQPCLDSQQNALLRLISSIQSVSPSEDLNFRTSDPRIISPAGASALGIAQ